MTYPLEADGVCFTSEPLLPAGPLFVAFTQAGWDTNRKISHATGLSTWVISTTRRRGTINAHIADELIIRHLDRHPVHVYGDSWLDRSHYRAGRADMAFEELTGVAS